MGLCELTDFTLHPLTMESEGFDSFANFQGRYSVD
jgi:hypothetical protein